MLNRLADDLIQNTRQNLQKAGILSLQDVRSHPQRLVTFSEAVESDRREAKNFLYTSLYFSPSLEPEKQDAERVISELFAYWMKKPEALPSSYQEKAQQEPLPRVVCDYIAGMTDNFICEQYDRCLGSRIAS